MTRWHAGLPRRPRPRWPALVALVAVAVLAGCRDGGSRSGSSSVGGPDAAAVDAAAGPSSSGRGAPMAAAEPPGVGRCAADATVLLFASPQSPKPGGAMQAVAVTAHDWSGTLRVTAPDGAVTAQQSERRGAGPYFWIATAEGVTAGRHELAFERADGRACAEVFVGAEAAAPRKPVRWGTVWPVYEAWSAGYENLFSAWIEQLFDAPLEEQPSWPVLHDVLRDPARNFLYDYLGEGEDDPRRRAPNIDPDCADLPYFLRAYFAFKLGLPFGYSRCSRGGRSGPPTCARWSSNLTTQKVKGGDPLRRFANFLAVNLANAVHSGAVRAVATDDGSDFYPIRLRADSLRPGAIYADPYGHILMVVRRVAQPPADGTGVAARGGLLLAVDGQPDGTVARRRFWRGNFLFSADPALGGPGFKRFRPVVLEAGVPRPLGNAEIAADSAYGDYSPEQSSLGVEGFYDRMDEVLSPAPIDPRQALTELVDALDEQVRRRVTSVQNGVDYLGTHPGAVDMPALSALFETEGPWEDYSTPSRDMRLLIAIDVVRGFAARAARRPGRFALDPNASAADVEAELVKLTGELTTGRRFTYRRSDGSEQSLTVADVMDRAAALEMAYNPNDCPEIRWGAPEGSAEARTCRRRAPQEQRKRMAEHRRWFAKRERPPRGT